VPGAYSTSGWKLSSELCQSWYGAKEKWWGFCNQYGNDNRMLFAFGPLEQPPLSLIVSLIFQNILITTRSISSYSLPFFAVTSVITGNAPLTKPITDQFESRSPWPEDNPPRYQHPRISDD
jgi:hypothetical protein